MNEYGGYLMKQNKLVCIPDIKMVLFEETVRIAVIQTYQWVDQHPSDSNLEMMQS